MAIGTGWEDGAWIDAGWAAGAWSSASPPAPAPFMYTENGLRKPRLQHWDDAEAAGGSLVAHVPRWGRGSEVEKSLRGDGGLRLTVPAGDGWVSAVKIGHVLQLHDDVVGTDGGEFFTPAGVEEYRVSRIRRVDGADSALARIEAQPILTDLVRCGPLYQLQDGVPNYRLGEMDLTWDEAWDDFVLPFLTDLGITWWTKNGSAGVAVRVSVDNVTPLALLRAIQEAQDIPIQAEVAHNGATDIKIHSVTKGFTLGASSATRKLHVSRDQIRVLGLSDTQTAERMATVAVPVRTAPSGASQDIGLTGLVFEVTNVSGSDLTLLDPETGSAFFADQLGGASTTYPNHYVLKPNEALTEITDHAGSVITVADATGVSVGDLVEILRDSSGGAPLEAVNPAALAAQGRIVVPVQDDNPAGRNYARNGLAVDWPTSTWPAVYTGRVDSTDTGGANSIDLKDLPTSTTITDNSVLWVQGVDGVTTVNGDQATSGSGTITLAIDSDFSATADTKVLIWITPELPNQWHTIGGTSETEDPTGFRVPTWWKRRLDPGVDITGDITADVAATVTINTTGTTGDVWEITLKNASVTGSAALLQGGDVIYMDASPNSALVVVDQVELTSGTNTVRVWPRVSTTWTLDDPVTITRMDFAGLRVADDGAGILSDRPLVPTLDVLDDQTSHGFLTEPFVVLHREGWVLQAHVRWAVWNTDDTAQTFDPAGSSVGSLRTVIVDAASIDSFAGLAAVEEASTQFAARTLVEVEQRAEYSTTATDTYRVRLEGFRQASLQNTFFALPLEVQVSYGPVAYDQVGTEASHTNVLYLRLSQILQSFETPHAIEAQVRDIAYSTEETPDARVGDEKIILGAPWFLRSDALGLGVTEDFLVRVVRYTHDLHDLTAARVVLDHDVFRLSHGEG